MQLVDPLPTFFFSIIPAIVEGLHVEIPNFIIVSLYDEGNLRALQSVVLYLVDSCVWLQVTTRSVLPSLLWRKLLCKPPATLPAFVAGFLKIQYILKAVINKQMVQAHTHAKK